MDVCQFKDYLSYAKTLNSFSSYNYYKCREEDWKRLRDYLHDVEWNLTNDPEQDLTKFYNTMLDACSKTNIPKSTNNKEKKKSKFKRLRRVHFRRLSKLSERNDDEAVKKRAVATKKLTELYDEERRVVETNAANKIKLNPKYFFQYVKSHCSQREEVGDLLDGVTGKLVEDDSTKSTLLLQHNYIFNGNKANLLPLNL